MQNKINLDAHNVVIPVNEPWHRGSGFTWMLLALAGVVFFLSGAVAKAATGFFGDGSGGAIFYDVNGSTSGEGTYRSAGNLNTFDYGDFVVSSGNLLLRGGEGKTYKNSGGNVTGVNQYYRIYKEGGTAGSYSSIALPWSADLGGGDQRWKKTDSNINLLSGLTSSGRYVTEIYWEQLGNQGTQYLSNGGSNYKTYFDLYYEISTTGSVNQDVSGGATVLDGSGQFVKKGTGTVTLNNANNAYTGATYIDAGTVAIAQGATAGSGTIHVGLDGTSSTATISISDADGGTTASNQINIRAGGGTRTVHGANTSGSNTFSGAIFLDSDVTLSSAAGGTLNISGILNDGAGAGGFGAVISAGKVEFSGSSSNTGLTGYTVNNGAELRLNKTSADAIQSTLTVNSGGTATLVAANQLGSGAVVNNIGTLATGNNSDSFATLNSSGNVTGSGTLTATTYNITGGTVGANLGAGTLNASGNSTINGNTTASTLNVTGDTTLNGTSSATTVAVSGSGTDLNLGSGGNRLSSSADVTVAANSRLNITSNQTLASVKEAGISNGGQVDIGSGAKLTINGANKGDLFQNTISGSGDLEMAGSGTTTLALYGTQSYTGNTTVSGGKISTAVALATAGVTVSGGTFETTAADILGNSASVNISSGTYSLGGSDTVGSFSISGGTLGGTGKLTATTYGLSGGAVNANLGAGTVNANSGTTALNGTVDATTVNVSGGTLNLGSGGRLAAGATANVSSGTLSTGGNETITRLNATGGTVNLTDDTLTVTGTGANASSVGSSVTATGGTISVQGALDYQASSGSTALSIASGGTLTGSGTTTGKLTVSSGGTLAVGNSPGTMSVGSADWLGGGTYSWEINNISGTAGGASGWDLLDVNGLLDIQATSASPFVIALISLTSGNAAGQLAGFDVNSNYSFAIAYFDSINGFASNKFSFDTTAFGPALNGSWSLITSLDTGAGGQDELLLNYTTNYVPSGGGGGVAIPEPSSASMLVLGLAALLAQRRRCRR